MRSTLLAIILSLALLPTLQAADHMPLKSVRTFMYQIDGTDDPAAIKALADSNYDMIVIEPTFNEKGEKKFDAKGMVATLHAGKPGRIVVAYLDACQAETFRAYWQPTWKKPTKTSVGDPSFLLIPDPDGWHGDFNVAYWDPAWQELFVTGKASEVRNVMAAGFDGVYLDWIDAYDDDSTAAPAKKAGLDPAKTMVDFLLLIRHTAQEMNPNAVVIQQNAYGLIDADPRLVTAIDGMGVEDTWFSGKANAKWGSKRAGDVPNRAKDEDSTERRLAQYQKFIAAGKPVFSVDYCVNPTNAATVYAEAGKHNLVPLVTEVSLDHLTATPPPG